MSWEAKNIGDVCEVIVGQSPEGSYYNDKGDGMPFYQGKKEFGEKFIGEPTTWTTYVTKVAEPGDILMSVRAPVGPVNFTSEQICIGRGLAAIRPRSVDKEFLFYSLLAKQDDISGRDGAVFPTINKKEIEAIQLSVPPLPEQQRIVTKLDAAFAALSEAEANVERNRANARELFESYLNGVFEGAVNEVEVHALGDMVDFQGGSQPPKSEFIYEPRPGYVRFLQIRDFKRDDKVTYIPISKKNRTCEEHDIMLGRYGASVGNVLTGRSGAYNVALIKTIPSPRIDRDYFYYYLQSRFFQRPLFNVAARSAQDGFSKDDISNFQLPLPDLSAQRKISASLTILKVKSDELESTYQQKLLELEGLKKALLGAAFRGEL
jgi:type I restriction enzyme S subunit